MCVVDGVSGGQGDGGQYKFWRMSVVEGEGENGGV